MNRLLSLVRAWRSLFPTKPVGDGVVRAFKTGGNICRDCADAAMLPLPYPPGEVTAPGRCATCGARTVVLDPALMRHYRAQGLDVATVQSHLPLLRHPGIGGPDADTNPLTWHQIDKLIAALPSPEEPR